MCIYYMELAFLLINCEQNKDDTVLKKLIQFPGIKEVTKVFGVHDLVAKIEARTTSELRQKIIPIVKNIVDIRSVLTLKSTNA